MLTFASARPKRSFQEVGLIEVQQEGANYDDAAEIIGRLREDAAPKPAAPSTPAPEQPSAQTGAP